MGPPEALILALQEQTGIDDFIETGAYRGDTTAWAAKHFARVTTIELSPELCAAAQERFRAQPTVCVRGGDSRTALGESLRSLAGPAVFWLDAHWSGAGTAGGATECPVLAEIAQINASAHEHFVLVDDARLFCAPPPRPHRADQWPDLATIVEALRQGGRRHVALFEDVFIAVPNGERGFLSAFLQSQATAAWQAAPRGLGRWWKRMWP